VLAANQAAKVPFTYTFTAEDASQVTVNFKVVVTLQDENGYTITDALPADNTAISLPVRMRK